MKIIVILLSEIGLFVTILSFSKAIKYFKEGLRK